MGTQNSQIAILVLYQCSISAVFPIVRFAGDQKTALTGESLYYRGEAWKVSFPFLLKQCTTKNNNERISEMAFWSISWDLFEPYVFWNFNAHEVKTLGCMHSEQE